MIDLKKYFDFLEYEQHDKDKLQRQIYSRCRIAQWGLLIAITIGVSYCVSINNDLEWLKWMKEVWGLFPLTIMLSSLLTVYLFIIGVKKNWKPAGTSGELKETIEKGNELIINAIKEELENVKKIEIELCNNCDKYSESKKMISDVFKKEDTHQKFIEYYTKVTEKRSSGSGLENVKEQFKQSGYTKLLCVLSNNQYFDTEKSKTLEKLTNYFLSFYPYIGVEGKRIKRIFSKSVIFDSTEESQTGLSSISEEKKKWLLQYILANIITGVETYLLVSEEDIRCHVDYVIKKTEQHQSNRVYFSDDRSGVNHALISKDQLLLTVLEDDFYNRLYGEVASGENRLIYDAAKGNGLFQICDQIQITHDDLCEVIQKLENYINGAHLNTLKNRKTELIDNLKETYYCYLLDFIKKGNISTIEGKIKKELLNNNRHEEVTKLINPLPQKQRIKKTNRQ